MSRRISKRVRAQAVLIASCEASNPEFVEDTFGAAAEIGLPKRGAAAELAFDAWRHVVRSRAYEGYEHPRQAVPAEAESLLRTGWTP